MLSLLFLVSIPFAYLASFCVAFFDVMAEKFSSVGEVYKPTLLEWIHLGRKDYLNFRRRIKSVNTADLMEMSECYKHDQSNIIIAEKPYDLIDRLLPIRWPGIYHKTCEFELAKRGE